MNSLQIKSQIKLYLSRFETLVRISSLNNEYDINKHSENFLIPFLKLIYGWDLINTNTEDKNSKSIDLMDLKNKIAIQVSSDNSISKIKSTFQKFLSSKYKDQVKKFYFYFLIPKQRTYSLTPILKILKKKISFNKSNIIDGSDIYSLIQSLTDLSKLKVIHSFLESEFSDFVLRENVSIQDYENFKENYKHACINNYTRLNFFGLSIPNKPREVQLFSLFVKPGFQKYSGKSKGKIKGSFYTSEIANEFASSFFIDDISTKILPSKLRSQIKMNSTFSLQSSSEFLEIEDLKYHYYLDGNRDLEFKDLFSIGSHIVLLGDPGAGKSSLIKYSICKIIQEELNVFEDKNVYNCLPYRIELHKYNQFKKLKSGGFINYVKHNLIDEFQIDINPDVLDSIIDKIPSIFFFDGLDEIFDIQERLQVRNDIENFIKQHPLIKSVVTSRYESYGEVKLNEDVFQIFEVKDFNNDQIKEYVEKWYEIEEANEDVKKQEVRDCLGQLRNIDNQLKHNPLLLSLILILYRNEQDLPTSKLEIYEGCAQTLIETRDKKEKKIDFNLKVFHKISVFSNLAYWQFSNESNNKSLKIDYQNIKGFISSYLLNKGDFIDLPSAEEAAKQFLDYAKVRSIYFENKFTHKTFYEYFIAYYIFSNYYSTPGQYENLYKLLIDNIGQSTWSVILELLICKIDETQIEYKVLDGIIDFLRARKAYETCYLFVSIMPHLRTLSPSRSKLIIENILELIISTPIEFEKKKNLIDRLLELIKIIRFKEIFNAIIDEMLSEKDKVAATYFDFTFEINVLTNNDFDSLIKKHENYLNDSKYFILSSLGTIKNSKAAWDFFIKFLTLYRKDAALVLYKSNYDFKIFKGKSLFNPIIFLVEQFETEKDFYELQKKLNSCGIEEKDFSAMSPEVFQTIDVEFLLNNIPKLKSIPFFKSLISKMKTLNKKLLSNTTYIFPTGSA